MNELQEMPDPIGLTALVSLTIEYFGKLRAMPSRIGKLGALKQLTLRWLHALQEMPDLIGLTTLDSLAIQYIVLPQRALPRGIGELGARACGVE